MELASVYGAYWLVVYQNFCITKYFNGFLCLDFLLIEVGLFAGEVCALWSN